MCGVSLVCGGLYVALVCGWFVCVVYAGAAFFLLLWMVLLSSARGWYCFCKYNTYPEPEIHEHIYVTKRLRNNVHDYKHILTYIETTVTNCVNDTTHTDDFTAQH